MKKFFLMFLMVFIVSICSATPFPNTAIIFEDGSGVQKNVTASSPLPVNAVITAATDSVTISTGILGTATLSIPLASVVALPAAPSGARHCYIMPDQDVNWGSTTVSSGTAYQYFFQLVPGQGFFNTTTFTSFRLIGRTAIATATIVWR